MRGGRAFWLLLGLSAVVLSEPGCGGRVLEGASSCRPGEMRSCWCTRVDPGVQRCDPDTARWALCECEPAEGTGGAADPGPAPMRATGGALGAGGRAVGLGGRGIGGANTVGLGGRGVGGGSAVGSGGSVEPTDEVCYGLPLDGTEPARDCAGEAYEARAVQMDLYLMMDRSVSMLRDVAGVSNDPAPPGESRWDGVAEAMRQLVADPSLADVGLGVQFFGADILASEELNCDPANYSSPLVPIGDISEVGDEIIDAYDTMGEELGGLTPTLPALQGALAYAATVRAERGRPTAVVLVTDGQPTQCQEPISVSEIADEAERGLLEDDVSTHVIGVGAGLFNLHRIAQAGGTEEAFLIEGGDAAEQFRAAITAIANSGLRCEFEIPMRVDPALTVDLSAMQVVFQPTSGFTEELPALVRPVLCLHSPNGGWFFDDTTDPQRIGICDCNCNRLDEGTLEIRLGCEPRVFDGE